MPFGTLQLPKSWRAQYGPPGCASSTSSDASRCRNSRMPADALGFIADSLRERLDLVAIDAASLWAPQELADPFPERDRRPPPEPPKLGRRHRRIVDVARADPAVRPPARAAGPPPRHP